MCVPPAASSWHRHAGWATGFFLILFSSSSLLGGVSSFAASEPPQSSSSSSSWWHKLPRLYLGPERLREGGVVILGSEQAHFLVRVMRCRDGDSVRVFDGQGGMEFSASLSVGGGSGGKADLRNTSVRVCERLRSLEGDDQQQTMPPSWLLFAPIKRNRTKMLLEKGTEIGVDNFIPVLTDRTQHGADDLKPSKWEATIIEATEQSERLLLPSLHPTTPFHVLMEEWKEKRSRANETIPIFFCRERSASRPLLNVLKEVPTANGAAFLVGPEGGFTQKECDLLDQTHFVHAVSLGDNVLRAETAALYALSCWSAHSAAQ